MHYHDNVFGVFPPNEGKFDVFYPITMIQRLDLYVIGK